MNLIWSCIHYLSYNAISPNMPKGPYLHNTCRMPVTMDADREGGCGRRWILKGEIRNRFNLISEERLNNFELNNENLMKIGWKNKKVMTLWSFANFHETFLETSIWICKWVSWWCHSLTTCHIVCTYNFENVNILPKFVIVCPSYQDILQLTLFCIYSERKSKILTSEILNFCHFCVQNKWKIVRRWHHQLTHLHIHIDWSRNVSSKFAKVQSVITSLLFNRFLSSFHCFVWNFYSFFRNKVKPVPDFPFKVESEILNSQPAPKQDCMIY